MDDDRDPTGEGGNSDVVLGGVIMGQGGVGVGEFPVRIVAAGLDELPSPLTTSSSCLWSCLQGLKEIGQIP